MEGSGMAFAMTNLTPVITAITDVVNVSTIIPVIAGILGTGIVFSFMWFGIRKAVAVARNTSQGRKLRV